MTGAPRTDSAQAHDGGDSSRTDDLDGTAVQEHAMEVAAGLPAVTHEHPFGPDWEVFKVVGKVFLLVTEVPGEPIVVLKAEPEHSEALRQERDTVTPGYHMNKEHWITLHGGAGVTEAFVGDLVRNSYELVVETLPQGRRPVRSGRRHRPD
ncbi:MmcQ/YjbR family DNA-binding protein [Curtobacterium sp. MCSS17_011]|uniref:MmcQ/YjbR family DNA-binding protein n=1 Tax=Curtobacterium sp. MCSS17_011 TaxID=2175643 RepID=UPI0021AC8244|nr:MmcQ/YjbR family DNA-binding protein [Curtobacterium sp. MCSS17_011]